MYSSKGHQVRPYSERDRDALLAFHQQVFGQFLDRDRYDRLVLVRLRLQLRPDRMVVSEEDGQVVGMGSYLLLGDDVEVKKTILRALSDSRALPGTPEHDTRKKKLEAFLEGNRQRCLESGIDSGPTSIEHFCNPMTQGAFEPSDRDAVITDLAVREGYRGRGIGREIARTLVSLIDRNGSAYAQGEFDDASVRIFDELRFITLLRISPRYDNGRRSTIMGRSFA